MFYDYNYNQNLVGKSLALVYEDETYVDITDQALQGVLPFYMISSYGHVYSKHYGYLMSTSDDGRGYEILSLMTEYGRRTIQVHRLLMLMFYYRDDYKDLEINHIDGNKKNNKWWNLEWVTPFENMHHAYDNGLNNCYAENSPRAILSNDQVHIICQGLELGVPFEEIAASIGPTSYKNIYNLFNGILRGECWKSISYQYNFTNYNSRVPHNFSNREIMTVCECLEKNMNYKEILEVLGYDIDTMSKRKLDNYNHTISSIRNGKLYTSISKNFVFHTQRSCQIFSNDQIHYICKCLEKGASFDRILESFNINKDNTTIEDIKKYKSILSAIKNKTRFTKISCDYNF